MKQKYIHYVFRLLFLFLISNCIVSNSLFGQEIEWVYEVEDQVETISNLSFVDKEGNSYYSIIRINPKSPGTVGYGVYLLMLDKDGNYKRTTYIKGCKRSRRMLPFGEDKLLSIGEACGMRTNNVRLYDYDGNTVKIGETFPGTSFAYACYDDTFTFFTRPRDKWGYSYITIGGINKKLKTKYVSIDLSELKREDRGLHFSNDSPVKTENGVWAISATYGEVKGQSLDPKSGFVLGVKKSKIIWRYPKVDKNYLIYSVCGFENKIGAYFNNLDIGEPAVFVFLNNKGEELRKFTTPERYGGIRGLSMTEDRIVILDQNFISWYDHEGNLKSKLDLRVLGFTYIGRMELLENGDIILAARRNGNGVMMRINADKEEEPVTEEEGLSEELEVENDTLEPEALISYSSIDEVLEENIVSATVYPNPTSAYIYFKVHSDLNENEAFTVQIFDSSGRLVISESTHRNNDAINVQNLPSGVYVYRLKSKKNELINGQFVKTNR